MTVKESYQSIGADYDDVCKRFGGETLVKRFALKFQQDPSYENLVNSIEAGQAQEAFRAAHTLKGICANLSLTNLYSVSAALTEKLRDGKLEDYEEDYQKVKEQYQLTIAALSQIS